MRRTMLSFTFGLRLTIAMVCVLVAALPVALAQEGSQNDQYCGEVDTVTQPTPPESTTETTTPGFQDDQYCADDDAATQPTLQENTTAPSIPESTTPEPSTMDPSTPDNQYDQSGGDEPPTEPPPPPVTTPEPPPSEGAPESATPGYEYDQPGGDDDTVTQPPAPESITEPTTPGSITERTTPETTTTEDPDTGERTTIEDPDTEESTTTVEPAQPRETGQPGHLDDGMVSVLRANSEQGIQTGTRQGELDSLNVGGMDGLLEQQSQEDQQQLGEGMVGFFTGQSPPSDQASTPPPTPNLATFRLCPNGQPSDTSGNCPDEPVAPPCPDGQHEDETGSCVPDETGGNDAGTCQYEDETGECTDQPTGGTCQYRDETGSCVPDESDPGDHPKDDCHRFAPIGWDPCHQTESGNSKSVAPPCPDGQREDETGSCVPDHPQTIKEQCADASTYTTRPYYKLGDRTYPCPDPPDGGSQETIKVQCEDASTYIDNKGRTHPCPKQDQQLSDGIPDILDNEHWGVPGSSAKLQPQQPGQPGIPSDGMDNLIEQQPGGPVAQGNGGRGGEDSTQNNGGGNGPKFVCLGGSKCNGVQNPGSSQNPGLPPNTPRAVWEAWVPSLAKITLEAGKTAEETVPGAIWCVAEVTPAKYIKYAKYLKSGLKVRKVTQLSAAVASENWLVDSLTVVVPLSSCIELVAPGAVAGAITGVVTAMLAVGAIGAMVGTNLRTATQKAVTNVKAVAQKAATNVKAVAQKAVAALKLW